MAEKLKSILLSPAQTEPKGARGFSAFIVEKGTPGFSFGKKENKMGIRASCTTGTWFLRIAESQRKIFFAREGMGFIVAMKTLDRTRPGVAAQALGIAQGAFDEALNIQGKEYSLVSRFPLSRQFSICWLIWQFR